MVNITRMTKKKLGELLIGEGLLREEQVEEALKRQKETGDLLGEVLVKLGYVTESDIARTIATQFAIPFIKVTNYHLMKEVVDSIPSDILIENQIIPIDKIGDILIIAIAGLIDKRLIEELENITNCQIQVYVSTSSEVKDGLKKTLEVEVDI